MAFHHVKHHKAFSKEKHPFLDRIIYISGITSLLMMTPQLKLIFAGKNAAGIEPITWLALAVLDIPWIIYGFAHKEKPLIFIYSLWLLTNALVFIGAVIY